MNDMAVPEKSTPMDKMDLNSEKCDGVESLSPGQRVTVISEVEVLNVGKHAWSEQEKKKTPVKAECQVLSQKIKNKLDAINAAETEDDLREAMKGE